MAVLKESGLAAFFLAPRNHGIAAQPEDKNAQGAERILAGVGRDQPLATSIHDKNRRVPARVFREQEVDGLDRHFLLVLLGRRRLGLWLLFLLLLLLLLLGLGRLLLRNLNPGGSNAGFPSWAGIIKQTQQPIDTQVAFQACDFVSGKLGGTVSD
jgi:hypothetical protein